MFLKILKKDLKRKKAMNVVLFVLIALASTLVASSTNLMYSTTTAVNSFISKSQVADLNIMISNTPENDKMIEEWANDMPSIDAYYSAFQIGVSSNTITVPTGSKEFSSNTSIFLASLPQDVNLVFGQNDKNFTLQDGEIALPINIKNTTGIQLGDQLTINVEGLSKTFIVKGFFKDAFLGSDLLGIKRLLISQHDFDEIKQSVPEETWIKLWSFVKNPEESQTDITTEFSKSDILSIFDIDKALVELSYMTDRIMSALLFIVSLFLIFIAFLTLRFTIISTIQDDYREIGVMKAIGFTNAGIRGLYLTKYFGLSVAGGAIGLGISLPLTIIMSLRVSEYVIVPVGSTSIVIAVFSIFGIVAVTLLFCALCMRKINKASPIDAIRQGHNGERFKASRKMSLHKSKFLHTTMFLAISDVLNQMKGYTTLILTFVLSTVIILIPINLANTILAPGFINYFGTTQADFYPTTWTTEGEMSNVLTDMESLEQEFRDKNFDVSLSVDYYFNTKYILENGEGARRIIGMKNVSKIAQNDYLDGVSPKLENEIAITGMMAEAYNKHIGDTVVFEIDGKIQTFLISGIFQTITNEGYMVRLSDAYQPFQLAGYQFMGNINASTKEKPQIIENMKEQFGHLKIKSAMDMMGDLTGGFMGQLKMINGLIIATMSLILFFITSLFVRLLITKEVHGIAIMKSLGFTNGQIKLWQSLRILILLVSSIILGVFFANVFGEKLVGMLFRLFGLTKFDMDIVALQVYVWCPLLIVTVVLLAVYSSCGQIKKIHVWNMNEE
ncbi:ABC transporter permease [Sporosarcina sp. YIM B06819]|uniref:ABC transporter permease n=1 Tax=Sporosarcina sp. YIM B06819 TaxID=3081769 RepID=UPI00298C0406|nr:FtsX-like permease family protein [Sporosarcina sp. YIM B06819]